MRKIQFVIALFAAAFVLSCSNSDVSTKSCKVTADCNDGGSTEYVCKNEECVKKGSSSSQTEYDRVPIGGYCDLALECNDGTGGKYECVNKTCIKLVPKTEEPEDPEDEQIVGKTCSSESDCKGSGTVKYVCVESKCAKDSSQTDDPDEGIVGKSCSSASDCKGSGTVKYVCTDSKCAKDSSQTSEPDDPNKPRCGDGNIDKDLGEVCDGSNLNGMKCNTLNEKYYGGILKCSDTCAFDESGCLECDVTDLVNHGCAAGMTCQNSHCVSDGSNPEDPEKPEDQVKCGNGTIDSSDGEVCDGSNLDGKKCHDFDEKYYSGILKCAPTCKEFDDSQCFECDPTDAERGCGEGKKCQDHHCVAETCGNGTKDDGEFCDGSDLGGKSCDDLVGYKGGTLKCFATCSFDSSECKIDLSSKTCTKDEDCSKGYSCKEGTCKAKEVECDPLDSINHPCPDGKTCSQEHVCV
ncbi:MAG: hypothetical protein IJU23_13955 [Proteobacteria bacterium]|nr:hypothetical protein [Pseudomonadota bacterium]